MHNIHQLLDIQAIIAHYGYLGIFLIVFLESGLIFFLPGDSLLFTAGILAAAGSVNILILLPLIFFSTFLGGMMGYHIGVHSDRLRKFSFFRQLLKEKYIERAHVFFVKYGKTAVIYSRFVPIVRTFVPIVAGFGRMNYSLFIRYSLISSVLWAFVATLAGYFLGHTFPKIIDYMSVVIIAVVLLSLLPPIIEVVRNRKSKNS